MTVFLCKTDRSKPLLCKSSNGMGVKKTKSLQTFNLQAFVCFVLRCVARRGIEPLFQE